MCTLFHNQKTFLFQAIQFSQTVLIKAILFSLSVVSMSKTVLFQAIQFCMCILFHNQKTFLFQAIQFSQTVLIQAILFSLSVVSMSKTVLFQAIQFCIITQFSSIWPIDRALIRCYYSRPESTREWWQWRGTPHSPKLQHYWNLTVRLFRVISKKLVEGVLPLCWEAICVFYSSSRLGNLTIYPLFVTTYILFLRYRLFLTMYL